jgi:macrolide transport system ATP-binding/permease protein
VNLEAGSHIEYVHAARISQHYLDVLRIHPLIGRNFADAEDRPHGPKTAILSYSLWRNTFASNRNLVGQAVLLKGEPVTIIGVLPEGVTTPANADLYTAIQASREGEGTGTNFVCITRLRDGASWHEADAQINRAWLYRNNRYEWVDNPGAQVTYNSQPLQKGETEPLRPQVLALIWRRDLSCSSLAPISPG